MRFGSDGDWLAMPSYRDGNLIAVKYRTADKRMRAESNCEPCLFGWQALPETARSVAICEGEADCAALRQYGMPSLSVPNGGGRKQSGWIEHEYDRLNRFDTIWLVMDQDEPGREAAAEILDRLGADRCRVVALPHKDANECLIQGITKDQLRQCFRQAQATDPEELRRPSEFNIQIIDQFFAQQENSIGFGTPFQNIADQLRFRPGELVIVAGVNGSGKSQYMGHQAQEAIRAGYRCCVASMEMKPKGYLSRMVRQAAAMREPSAEYIQAITAFWNDRLWLFDVVGTAKSQRMLEVFRYARRRYNIRVFVIDNLAKCGIAEDDYNGQKDFVDVLGDFAKETDSTVFLVHHMRKGGQDKEGIKGSGAITDMADTVLIVARNKAKEDALRSLPPLEQCDSDQQATHELWSGKPDGSIACRKQRNGEDEPYKSIWFDRDSFQFLSGPASKPYRYVQWSAIEQRGVA